MSEIHGWSMNLARGHLGPCTLKKFFWLPKLGFGSHLSPNVAQPIPCFFLPFPPSISSSMAITSIAGKATTSTMSREAANTTIGAAIDETPL